MNLLAAMFSLVAGLVLGAAIQRWGDRDRATEHHTRYIPETNDEVQGFRLNIGDWFFE